MSPITVLITIAAYFCLLFGISWWVGRGSNNAEFFNGGRQSKWYMVAFAMIGSMISGVTFVSVPGMVQTADYGYLQMVLGFIVGQLLIAYVLVPLFYRMNLTSIYEYLEQRFGITTYKTGAWFFFISKMLGAAVRFYLVCLTLQLLVFGPLGLPFVLNIACSMFLVWLYTAQGGVKSIIWADTLKSACLIISVVLSIYFIAADLNLDFSSLCSTVWNEHDFVFLNNVNAPQFFWKQFLAGIFTMIATNGLDQDMMQRNLSCRNSKDAQKNMITSGLMQLPVIALFLFLGTLLYLYAEKHGIAAVKDDVIRGYESRNYADAIQVINAVREPLMDEQYEITFALQNTAAKLIAEGQKEAAIQLLTDYSYQQAEMWNELYADLTTQLLARYATGRTLFKTSATPNGTAWWNKVKAAVNAINEEERAAAAAN